MSFIHAADKIRQPSYEEFSSNSESSPSSSNSLKDSLPAGVNVYSSSGGDEVSAAITTPKKSTSKSEPPLPDPFEDINPFGANAVTSSARPDSTSFSEYNPRSSSSAFTDVVTKVSKTSPRSPPSSGLKLNKKKNQVSVGIRNRVFGTIFYKIHAKFH